MQEILGQVFSWVAALFGFATYQCKIQKRVLITLSICGLSLCISYLLLGAYSGLALNIVGLIRNFVFAAKNKKIFSHKWWPVVFAGLMGFAGALSWQGPVSLLIIIALMLHTLFLSSENVQNLRKCILLTSSMVLLYNVYYQVWGGVLFEAVGIVSAIIGLIRFRKKSVPAHAQTKHEEI